MLDIEDYIAKAKKHFLKTEGASIPSAASYFDEEEDLIVLVNVTGVLAKYRFVGDRIKQLEYDPKWNE